MPRRDPHDRPDVDPFSGCHLGVDVGGTFTDLVFFDEAGTVHCLKVPSTKARPADSTLHGVAELGSAVQVSAEAWAQMHHTHSSTVALNALIERDGPRMGMLTTDGFRDLLGLQRFALPHPMRFDSRRAQPLVARADVREIRERITVAGDVLQPLCEDDVIAAAKAFLEEGIRDVVVCLLHSYRNPEHEYRIAELFAEHAPGVHVELSSRAWAQAREYERAALAAINAFVRPTIARYATDLLDGLDRHGITSAPRMARSNGGMELLATLRERPAAALLSGPAAGVSGAALAAAETDWEHADLLTLDVGGTSADIGVVRRGRAVLSSEEHIADFPLLLPSIAVSAIGAGGGSVIWLQHGDTLKVGPRSVGADPGPACYGRAAADAAAQPALTDAFLVTGLLAPEQQLAGRLPLHLAPAAAALEGLGVGSAEQAADAAIQIAVAMMAAEAVNVVSRRGVDVEEFAMVAYGGAGPLLAALLAEEIHVDSVLIPHTPGALSAFGAARADLEGDLIQPVYCTVDALPASVLCEHIEALRGQVESWVSTQSAELGLPAVVVQMSAEMRYDGQGYDVTVPLEQAWLDRADGEAILAAFHGVHDDTYGHSNPDSKAWLNELRAHVLGAVPPVREPSRTTAGPPPSPKGSRRLRLRGREFTAHVYHRDELTPDTVLNGPAVLEQMDTTTFVPSGWRATVHRSANIVLQREG